MSKLRNLWLLASYDETPTQEPWLEPCDYPHGGLVQATNGNFYGTTDAGGAKDEGTVFSITAEGALTTLLSFDLTDGAYPTGGLVQATNGTFYGANLPGWRE